MSGPGPTDYQLRAAVEVARIIDADGNPTADARGAYRHILTQGEHRATSLLAGEALLVRAGLLAEVDGRLFRTGALGIVATLDPQVAADAVRARLITVFDEQTRQLIGAAGETTVVSACRGSLEDLGRADLAAAVQQVSLVDDALGYDVHAPSIVGPPRLLEVKTSTRDAPGRVEFFLSRNEYTTGRREPESWAMVACTWSTGDDEAKIVGWCRASTIAPFLPSDGMGRWTEAFVQLPRTQLASGIPPAV